MNTHQVRITDLNMTMMDVMVVLAEGNPGALTCLVDIVKNGKTIDPDNGLGELGIMLSFDSYGIYGSDIYVLWSDICKRNTSQMVALLRAVQLGFLDRAVLKDASHRQDRSGAALLDIPALCKQVQERLPKFNLN